MTRVMLLLGSVGALAVCWAAVQMGRIGWPNVHFDGTMYVTPAVNASIGRPGEFSVYTSAFLVKGDWRFDGHGQLYQVVLSAVSAGRTLPEFAAAIGVINAATVLITFIYITILLRSRHGLSVGGAAACAALTAVVVANVTLYLQGRPEHVVPLILGVTGSARLGVPRPIGRAAIDGVEIGLVASVSPNPAVTLGLVRAVILLTDGAGAWGWRLAATAGIALLAWAAVVTAFTPYSPPELIHNTFRAGSRAATGAPRAYSLIHRVWLLDPAVPLVGVPFGLMFISLGVRVARAGLGGPVRRFVAGGALALAGLLAFTMSVRQLTPYNVLGLITLALVLSFELAGACRRGSIGRTAVVGLLTATALAGGVGFGRSVALVDAYCSDGVSLAAGRDRVTDLSRGLGPTDRIGIPATGQSLILLDRPPNWVFLAFDQPTEELVSRIETATGSRIAYYLLPQRVQGVPPLTVGPFTLHESFWTDRRPTLAGVALAPVMPGYQFAVYERTGRETGR